jgi:hypothetical protein
MKKGYKRVLELFFGVALLIGLNIAAFGQNMFRKMMDFDGDGKADFAVTRNIDGTKYWYIWQTTNGFRVFPWGFPTDENVAGDYDGDAKTDVAVFRKTVAPNDPNLMSYSFWIAGSQVGTMLSGWAYNTYHQSVAHQQDYNGDGKTDAAWTIDNGSRYFLIYSSGGTIGISSPGGTLIKIGDMTGDSKAEAAACNPGSNLVSIRNSATNAVQTIQFGLAGDEFMPADFDGDGKGDLTIFRQSNGQWWWLRSSDNVVNAATFGTTGDVPVPADYDGDGKTDIAIWRAGAQSYYWVFGSQVGVFVVPWGISSDTVVRY